MVFTKNQIFGGNGLLGCILMKFRDGSSRLWARKCTRKLENASCNIGNGTQSPEIDARNWKMESRYWKWCWEVGGPQIPGTLCIVTGRLAREARGGPGPNILID